MQPGGYWTNLYQNMTTTTEVDAYDPLRAQVQAQWAHGSVDSDPRLATAALLTLVDSDEPPLRLLLGGTVYDLAFDLPCPGRLALVPDVQDDRRHVGATLRERGSEQPVHRLLRSCGGRQGRVQVLR